MRASYLGKNGVIPANQFIDIPFGDRRSRLFYWDRRMSEEEEIGGHTGEIIENELKFFLYAFVECGNADP